MCCKPSGLHSSKPAIQSNQHCFSASTQVCATRKKQGLAPGVFSQVRLNIISPRLRGRRVNEPHESAAPFGPFPVNTSSRSALHSAPCQCPAVKSPATSPVNSTGDESSFSRPHRVIERAIASAARPFSVRSTMRAANTRSHRHGYYYSAAYSGNETP